MWFMYKSEKWVCYPEVTLFVNKCMTLLKCHRSGDRIVQNYHLMTALNCTCVSLLRCVCVCVTLLKCHRSGDRIVQNYHLMIKLRVCVIVEVCVCVWLIGCRWRFSSPVLLCSVLIWLLVEDVQKLTFTDTRALTCFIWTSRTNSHCCIRLFWNETKPRMKCRYEPSVCQSDIYSLILLADTFVIKKKKKKKNIYINI